MRRLACGRAGPLITTPPPAPPPPLSPSRPIPLLTPLQDDVALFCVFDGHGQHGHVVSQATKSRPHLPLTSSHLALTCRLLLISPDLPPISQEALVSMHFEIERSAQLASDPAAALHAAFEDVQALR